MIFLQELRRNRTVYIVDRTKENPCLHIGVILGIVCYNNSHYLRILTNEEVIRVQISGSILPDTLLNNSIFFEGSVADIELKNYKNYLKAHAARATPKLMGL